MSAKDIVCQTLPANGKLFINTGQLEISTIKTNNLLIAHHPWRVTITMKINAIDPYSVGIFLL